MEKLIKYHIYVQYHKKHPFEKQKTLSSNHKTIQCLLLWMMAFKTLLQLIRRLKWIWKMMYNAIKYGLPNTLIMSIWMSFFSCFLLIFLLFYKGNHMRYPILTVVTIWPVSFQCAFKNCQTLFKAFLNKKKEYHNCFNIDKAI